MECIIPWGDWLSLIKSYYYEGERGDKPYDLDLMLRLYLLQNLYNFSNEASDEQNACLIFEFQISTSIQP